MLREYNPVIQRRAGKKEPMISGFYDDQGRFVSMTQLSREIEEGYRYFWKTRGGAPANPFTKFGHNPK